jgi:aspartate aminotransferase-like enzyme
MDSYYVQAQDKSGNWRTYNTTPATTNVQRVFSLMESLQRQYPEYRIRTIDKNGRIIDIL